MSNTGSRELVPQQYHRGMILLTIQAMSHDKERTQVQLYELAPHVEDDDDELLVLIINKLNPEWKRSFNLLMDYLTAIGRFDQVVAEASLHRIECLLDWRERKSAFQRIVDLRPIKDGIRRRAEENLELMGKLVDLSEWKPKHKSKR